MPAHDHAHQHGDASAADLLELEVAVLEDYWAGALDWLGRAVGDVPVEHIVDLGAGPGAGTIALARRFPDAEFVAVDGSDEMLARVRAKAAESGLAHRVRTVLADLDDGWPEVGTVALTWASMSLHHVADPSAVLRSVHAVTRPGGLIAVAELAHGVREDPDLPNLGADWAPLLAGAGFELVAAQRFEITPRVPTGADPELVALLDPNLSDPRTITLARRPVSSAAD